MQRKMLAILVAILALAGLVTWLADGSGAGVDGGVERAPVSASDSRAEARPGARLDALRPVAPRVEPSAPLPGALVDESPRESVRDVEPAAPESQPVRVRVTGRCIDAAGVALLGVRVASIEPEAHAISDAHGRFDLGVELPGEIADDPSAPPVRGSLTVTAELEGYARLELEVDVPLEGGALELGDLVLGAAGSVSGRVVDARGSAVGGARVLATRMGPLGWGARGAGPDDPLVEGESAPDGRFRLAGLPEGEARVWGGAEDSWWAYSDAVPVQGGRETTDVLLRLEALQPEDVIELTVVDPDYQPVAAATVHYFYHQDGMSGSGSVYTDADGHYRRVLERRVAFDFCARDPRGRFRPAVARGVLPGTTGLVLVLGAPRALAVRVLDTAGKPVRGFVVSSRTVSEGRWLSGASQSAGEEGQEEVVFPLPSETFELTAEADGYESAVLGPLDPERVGARVELRLAPLPGVRGRVVDPAGRPVAGAEVGLHEGVGPKTELSVNGFPARSRKGATVTDRSDAEGRFSLTLRESGPFYLRAEAEGFAPGEIGPLELLVEVGARGLEVGLSEGGAIAGTLLLEPGRSAAGLVVGISRADGFARTVRTDAKGRYRFEGLTPGPWYVQRCSEEIREGWISSSNSNADEVRELPWSCEVWSGRTTHFDLDLSESSRVVLSGRLLFSGRPRPEWDVRLEIPGAARDQVAAGRVDSQGDFRLELGQPGSFVLTFSGLSDSALTRLEVPVELRLGSNAWSRDIPIGTIEGSVAPHLMVGETPLQLRWEGAAGLRFTSHGRPEAGGEFVRRVPAGDVTLEYGELVPREVRVAEAAVSRVDLP